METKYTPVTHADRIANMNILNNITPDTKLNIHWGKIIAISLLGIATMIYVSEYFRKKSKEFENQ